MTICMIEGMLSVVIIATLYYIDIVLLFLFSVTLKTTSDAGHYTSGVLSETRTSPGTLMYMYLLPF